MKYALVTGGSRGIGRAICLKLAQMGYYVLVNFQSNEKEAAKTVEMMREADSDGQPLRFDVGNAAETLSALTAWQEQNSGSYIEVLVNNAGIRRDNLMFWMLREEWDDVLNANLNGFFNVTQPLLKNMLAKRFGRIINIVSLSGIKGLPGQVNYSASKGAVIAATKALAQETARKGVTVNAVAPGFIRTDMVDGLPEDELKKNIPAERFGEPEEVAAAVAFLASKEASYITGEIISINGGLYT
ncbi:MAG: 3-oxoacyl-ACP reductase FabG [Prolixibacteraceae bacterium]|nr:3-oxoacyl-ACP reductase FabG [Prolixibacteraceae bacterium]